VSVTDEAAVVEATFEVEQHGINFIPIAERWARPRDLFGMWAGASFQIEYFVYGVILIAFFGLSFAQAIAAVIVGNISFFVLGLASLQGPQAGTTAMTINRAPYGPNGSRLIALFNWATQVGFETEGLVLVVFAGEVLMAKAGFAAGTPAKVILIVIAVCIQLTLPLFGYASIVRVLRWLVVPFIALFCVLAGFTLGRVDTGSIHSHASWQGFLVALAFTIALSGLGWSENGNDYSRYLPPSSNRRSIVGWVFLGTAIPEILVMCLGVAVGTYASSIATAVNPFTAFQSPHVVPTGLVVPLLIVAIIQLFAINSLDLYSSGVTLQALGLGIRRWQAVIVDTVIACGLTIYAIFSSSFHTLLSEFADCVICWIAPWLAIMLVDWALRGFRYVPAELQKTGPGGIYYRNGGVHWPAIIAQAIGTVAAVLAVSQTFFVGKLSRLIGADHTGIFPDFSIYFGITAAALVYLVLAGRSVRAEGRAHASLDT
jgi:nucleobase:cation symporter-1, NCS1 family